MSDFDEMYSRRKLENLDAPIDVTVVGRRCVYVNDHRVAGGKPYITEGHSEWTLNTTLGRVLDAFSDEHILSAMADRKHNREMIAKWRKENPRPVKDQAND